MEPTEENSQSENNQSQNITKKPYQTPELTEYGSISEIIKHNPGGGLDGDFFPDCSRS
jgi:uncharacterized Fe-S cluster protein YjdI